MLPLGGGSREPFDCVSDTKFVCCDVPWEPGLCSGSLGCGSAAVCWLATGFDIPGSPVAPLEGS